MDELLSNGYWKTSRAKTQTFASDGPTHPGSHRLSLLQTGCKNYKKPLCEDEIKSLSKEIDFDTASLASLHDEETPAKGVIDQHPILLESNLSEADVLKYENQSRADEAQSKKELKQENNEEKRFVLIPTRNSSFTEPVHGEEPTTPEKAYQSVSVEIDDHRERRDSDRSSRTSSRERKLRREAKYQHDNDSDDVKTRTLDPSSLKHRRRQGLPSLNTQDHQVSPSFFRSSSDHDFSSKSPERRRREASWQQNGNYLLSPQSPYAGRSPSKGYFDCVPRRFPSTQSPAIAPDTLLRDRGVDPPSPKSTFHLHQKRSSSAEPKAGALKHESHKSNPSAMYYVPGEEDSLTDDDDEPVVHRPHRNREHHHHSHHRKHSDHSNDDKHERHRRASSRSTGNSLEVKSASRLTSPNVSPTKSSFDLGGPERKDASKSSYGVVKNLLAVGAAAYMGGTDTIKSSHDRSKSRRTSPSTESIKSTRSSTHSFNIPMPPRDDIRFSADSVLSPSLTESGQRTPTSRSPTSLRTPQHFDTTRQTSYFPENHLHLSPVGSHRRESDDVSSRHKSRISACPRGVSGHGKRDWLTLPGCPSFHICPSCFKANIGRTEFAKHFVPSPKRPADEESVCSFRTGPWYRIAWILTLRDGRKDLRTFHDIAQIDSTVEPCPGPYQATRTWHSVIDPATHKPVEGFNVCLSCVKTIESVLPPLKGLFVPKAPYHGGRSPLHKTRQCDMHFESARFVRYFDVLVDTADGVSSTLAGPDAAAFAAMAKKYAAIDACPGRKKVYERKWHVIAGLPEYKVCADCYEDVVRPGRKRGLWIPMMFEKVPRRGEAGEGARCALATKEEKDWFRGTVEWLRDPQMFAKGVRARRRMA